MHTHALMVKAAHWASPHPFLKRNTGQRRYGPGTFWDGLFHGFFYNVDVPESRDCYDVVVKFFERHLGSAEEQPMLPLDRRGVHARSAPRRPCSHRVRRWCSEPPAPPAIAVPPEWEQVPRLPLWPGQPPGAASFDAGRVPLDWPSRLSPRRRAEVRVFRPRQPNGRAVMLVPGGAYWFVSFVNEGIDVARRLNERARHGIRADLCGSRAKAGRAAPTCPSPGHAARSAADPRAAAEYAIDARTVAVVGFSAEDI